MKNIGLAMIMVCVIGSQVMAQEMQSIFTGDINSGGYGCPIVKISDIGGETGLWVGGKGGWIINHSLVIGGGGYGLVNTINKIQANRTSTRQLAAGYGGVIFEYIYQPYNIVHLNAGALIGGGGVGHYYKNTNDEDGWSGHNGDVFFVIEPNVGVEINIARRIRCELGVSYLHTSGVELSDLNDKDLSGLAGYIALKVGEF